MSLENFLKKHLDIGLVILVAVIVSGLVIVNMGVVLKVYSENNLNDLVISVFGNLFGLLLTAYAILFGLLPVLKKSLLETDAFSFVNKMFLLGLFVNLLILSLGLLIYFVKPASEFLILVQMSVISFTIPLFVLILVYLYHIFKIAQQGQA